MKRILTLIITSLLLVSCAGDDINNTESTSIESEFISSQEETTVEESSVEETTEEESSIEEIVSEEASEESSIEESSEEEIFQKEPQIITEFEIIDNPYKELSNNGKNPWDMVIFNGCLYVGAGDYDKNVSPKNAYRYDLEAEIWEECGAIPDEQIDRFIVINDELYIPGTDPTEGWAYGNFFRLENDSFVKYRTLPKAIHTFDLVEYQDKLFAGIGRSDGKFPVLVSKDNGESFKDIPFSGTEELEDERVYQLFVFKERLYALCGTQIFEYNGDKFEFNCNWTDKYYRGYEFYTRIPAEVVYKDMLFLTSGYLYRCEEIEDIKFVGKKGITVTDMAVFGEKLYLLCYEEKENGNYRITLRESTDGRTTRIIWELEYDLPALSFALNGNRVFLGIGDVSDIDSEHKGNILTFEVAE